MTARPQPKLISSQPPPSPLLPLRIAVATTPQPSSSSIAVPVNSEMKISPFEMFNAASLPIEPPAHPLRGGKNHDHQAIRRNVRLIPVPRGPDFSPVTTL